MSEQVRRAEERLAYRVVPVIPARLALPTVRACCAVGDGYSTSIRILPFGRERAQIRSCARHRFAFKMLSKIMWRVKEWRRDLQVKKCER
jgi:hypothetical protein